MNSAAAGGVNEVFDTLKVILNEVAPEKITDEVTLEKSLYLDYGFDSVDLMATLLKVQEKFNIDFSNFDVGKWFEEASNNNDQIEVQRVCDLIIEHM